MRIKVAVSLFLVFSIIFVLYGNASATSPVTWNPSDKGTYAGLELNNMRATTTAGQTACIRATDAKSSGKWYWEITCTTDNQAYSEWGIGVAESSADLNATTYTNTTHVQSYRSRYSLGTDHGSLWSSGSELFTDLPTYTGDETTGDVIGVALDMDNKTLKFYKNGVLQSRTITSLPSVSYYPWVWLSAGSGAHPKAKVNFGPSSFVYSVPTGYLPYDNIVHATSVTLDRSSVSLDVGSDTTLVPTVSPSNTTDKSVTWSSSDATVASVDSTGKVTAMKAGTAVITVTTVDGALTDTCDVTVTTPHRAVLTISMVNGAQKEYDLSMTQVDAFTTWYDNRAGGTGSAYFVLYKSYNVKPFLSRKDYIIFDKIVDFEISEYVDSE